MLARNRVTLPNLALPALPDDDPENPNRPDPSVTVAKMHSGAGWTS